MWELHRDAAPEVRCREYTMSLVANRHFDPISRLESASEIVYALHALDYFDLTSSYFPAGVPSEYEPMRLSCSARVPSAGARLPDVDVIAQMLPDIVRAGEHRKAHTDTHSKKRRWTRQQEETHARMQQDNNTAAAVEAHRQKQKQARDAQAAMRDDTARVVQTTRKRTRVP